MREIITISMPPQLKKEIEEAIKEGNYASKSEFFRDALRAWKRQQLLNDLRISQKEFTEGKGKVLKSLKDLR